MAVMCVLGWGVGHGLGLDRGLKLAISMGSLQDG